MSYADQLYLMQLDFQRQAQARRDAVDRAFSELREEERRRREEREARDGHMVRGESKFAWEANELQIFYDEGDGE